MNDHELLSAYLDGELSPDQARGVEERLSADPRFREERFRLQQASAFVRVRCEPDPGFVVRHRERREDLSPVLRWTWRELGYRLAAAAAALLIAAGVSVWQTGLPEAETVADALPAVGDLDLIALEGQILAGQVDVAPDFGTLTVTDPAEEPVLLIALGGGFSRSGER